MIVSLKHDADPERVAAELAARGLWVAEALRAESGRPSHYVLAPFSRAVDPTELSHIEGVAGVAAPRSPHPLVSKQSACVDLAGVAIGAGAAPALMCGPCSVESEEQVRALAERLSQAGVAFLRGGAFKPRTSPYAFQGHGDEALAWLRRAADAFGMRVVTEALGEAHVAAVADHADLVQIGSRNMHNYALLRAVGKTGKPVLLKRGMAATLDEWLLSGEYLLQSGARAVVFCERGIRSFDASTRNLLDLGAVALLAHVHRQPVVVDPSHATGRRDLIEPLARAALAAGAAGLMIETHADPGRALSDGPQAVPVDDLVPMLRRLSPLPGAS